ncbi:MAG TPA: redoxin domain-containing protein [Thermodesulfobacteriota bacterium]
MKLNSWIKMILFSTSIFFSLITGLSALDNKTKAEVGSPAPDFTLEDQKGNVVKLSDINDSIIVLEWMNPDCPFVQRHYNSKTMTTLADKYREKNVVWMAINSTHYMNKEDDQNWINKFKVGYPILDDSSGSVGKLYDAKTTPNMYIIDPSGILVYSGAIDDDPRGSKDGKALNYVDQALEEILAGKTVTISQTKPYGCSVKYSN